MREKAAIYAGFTVLEQFWSILSGGMLATLSGAGLSRLTGWVALCGSWGYRGWGATGLAIERGYWAFVIVQYLKIWKEAEGRLPDPDSTKRPRRPLVRVGRRGIRGCRSAQ